MSSHAGTIDHHHDPSTSTGIPNKKLIMWAFLASDCMFFATLISTHLIYRLHPPAGGLDPKVVFSLELTSFSTFILLMSSLMMALAVTAIQKGNVKSCRWSLLATILFGMIFLGCQVYEFNHFVVEKKMTLSNSLLGTTFYTLTGTHGCHVAIGVLWLILMYVRSFKPPLRLTRRSWFGKNLHPRRRPPRRVLLSLKFCVLGPRPRLRSRRPQRHRDRATSSKPSSSRSPARSSARYPHRICPRRAARSISTSANAIDVESMGLYWHFVDIVWIVIFTAVYLLEYL
jgi:cytochrome o ubiquinol oxidase subunit 3